MNKINKMHKNEDKSRTYYDRVISALNNLGIGASFPKHEQIINTEFDTAILINSTKTVCTCARSESQNPIETVNGFLQCNLYFRNKACTGQILTSQQFSTTKFPFCLDMSVIIFLMISSLMSPAEKLCGPLITQFF